MLHAFITFLRCLIWQRTAALTLHARMLHQPSSVLLQNIFLRLHTYVEKALTFINPFLSQNVAERRAKGWKKWNLNERELNKNEEMRNYWCPWSSCCYYDTEKYLQSVGRCFREHQMAFDMQRMCEFIQKKIRVIFR